MASARRTAHPAAAPHPDVLDDERVSAAVMSFALLADPTRMRLLWALLDIDAYAASLAEPARP